MNEKFEQSSSLHFDKISAVNRGGGVPSKPVHQNMYSWERGRAVYQVPKIIYKGCCDVNCIYIKEFEQMNNIRVYRCVTGGVVLVP